MKIESVQIKNIGPYIGDNTFSFDVTDSLRKMILIGGKNGAGKTTLFNAIKICLYGCVAYGFEANNSHYYEEVSKIINTSEKLKKSGDAAVIKNKESVAEQVRKECRDERSHKAFRPCVCFRKWVV